MRKSLMVLVVTMCALALSAGVQTANGDNGATVTRATLASFWFEDDVFYPATCDETQVINGNHRRETFHCTFDDAVPAPIVCDTSIGCVWFSDFDGAEAMQMHVVITRSGLMVGWAQF